MPSFQETFIDRESISEWAYMNNDLYGRVLERVFDTIMTFQHVEKIERMKRGASPWLLRFLSGYIQTIGPAAIGPCIGDLLKSHWAKHGCKRAADTNAAPSAPIDPSSMSSNKANAVEAPRRSHEPAVQPLPSELHSTGHFAHQTIFFSRGALGGWGPSLAPIDRANFAWIVLGCIEAKFCK